MVKKVVMKRIVSHGRAGAGDGTLVLHSGETLALSERISSISTD